VGTYVISIQNERGQNILDILFQLPDMSHHDFFQDFHVGILWQMPARI
jgi:hypothetical protein